VLLFHFTGVSTKRTDRQNCCIYIARQCADARQKLSKIDLVQIEHCQEVVIVEFVAAFSSCAWKIFGYQVQDVQIQGGPIKTVHFEIPCFFASAGRFSKFLHQMFRKKILYVRITKIFTSPAICCYTTV